MKKHYRQENDCLNCGTILDGKFCHNCGQENLQMKESFGHMINHAVSDYFHFDDQFFSTLKPLLLKPGKLTIAYLEGHRASYLHPVKMYIFISLLFFLLVFKNSKVKTEQETKAITNEHGTPAKPQSTAAKQQKFVAENIKGYVPDTLARQIVANMAKDDKADTAKYYSEDDFTILGNKEDNGKSYEEYLARQQKLAPEKRAGSIEKYFIRKSFDWRSHGKSARELFKESFQHNVPKMMFLLLPLFALILKVAFAKNHKFYVEHIIYAIHLHCFIFLFLIIYMLIGMIMPASIMGIMQWICIAATLIIIWYVYRSFRVVYNRSSWRTVSKMIGVSLMYSFAAMICFGIFIVITALTSV